jgi:hypothetical protein
VIVWRAGNLPPDPWTTAVVEQLHPRDDVRWSWLHGAHDVDTARQMSNLFRVCALLHSGGCWVDNDIIPLQRLTRAPDAWVAAVGARPEGCVMHFPTRGHPFLAAARDELGRNPHALLADVLAKAQLRYPVRLEQGVLPFDAAGRSTGVRDPLAVHTCATTSWRTREIPGQRP